MHFHVCYQLVVMELGVFNHYCHHNNGNSSVVMNHFHQYYLRLLSMVDVAPLQPPQSCQQHVFI